MYLRTTHLVVKTLDKKKLRCQTEFRTLLCLAHGGSFSHHNSSDVTAGRLQSIQFNCGAVNNHAVITLNLELFSF
jgi:hypothetical protein